MNQYTEAEFERVQALPYFSRTVGRLINDGAVGDVSDALLRLCTVAEELMANPPERERWRLIRCAYDVAESIKCNVHLSETGTRLYLKPQRDLADKQSVFTPLIPVPQQGIDYGSFLSENNNERSG